MSTSALINNKLIRMKRGTPFSIELFYSLGSITAVQKAMSRLLQSGLLVRIEKGIYSRPKPLANLPAITVIASAESLAKIWAKKNHYSVVPQGIESAYRLGLQTQAPIKTVYWTSGPTREFRVGNELVIMKHKAASKLRWVNMPEGEIYRGLLSLSPEFTTLSALQQAIKRLNLSTQANLKIINKLSNEPTLKQWKCKLIELKESLLL